MQAIIAGVLAAFGWIADKAATLAVILWNVTVIVGKALAWFAINLGGVFGKVYSLLSRFWSGVLRPFIAWTWGRIDKLASWLQRTFAPALKFLETLRLYVLKIYDTYFKPIFDTIEVVRRVLQLLAALHVDFARELDRKLAELEDRLLWPIREAMFRINQVSDWVNRIVTLDGLLQRITLLRSVARDVGRIGAIWHAAHTRPLTDEERRASPSAPGLKPPEEAANDFRVYLRTGQSPHLAQLEEALTDLRLKLASV